ncbi:general odorant-binding protein 99b-like [Anopheles merus]|uniref:Uncharacterized protein n=1 Tax=Anopheles merus TaxID=30066 RepID=A0A182VK37_ANOME|nr:general odorant-binding protein 99b-like [Anopheles merus]
MNSLLLIGGVLVVLNVQALLQFVTAADNNESVIESCSNAVQGANDELKVHYRANEFPDDPVTHCFVRCIGLELNLYDDKYGVDLQANWEYLGNSVDADEEFVAKHRACLEAKNLETIEDLCERAYSAFQCLREDYEMYQNNNNATS